MTAEQQPGYDLATLERAREEWADLYTGEGLAVSLFWVARANFVGPVTLWPGRQPTTHVHLPTVVGCSNSVRRSCAGAQTCWTHPYLSVARPMANARCCSKGRLKGSA